MRLLKKTGLLLLFVALSMAPATTYAATSPPLGVADPFSILAGTYTNTASGTTVNGDLGYVTGPATSPTVNGTTHIADGTYNQAGIDQATALSALNSQACSFSFAPGAIDLATDTTHGPVGVYAPGVYCVTGAASVGTAGITLNGSGTFIFRSTGALTTAANSSVVVSGGATACSLWWTPSAATTLGANSTFAGTIIDPSGITIGSTVTWTGRALAFGGTVSTTTDTINTVPACSSSTTTGGGSSSGSTTTSGSGSTTGANGTGTPGLPNTGLAAQSGRVSTLWATTAALLAVLAVALYVIRHKRHTA